MYEDRCINNFLELTGKTTLTYFRKQPSSSIDYLYDALSNQDQLLFINLLKQKYHYQEFNSLFEEIINIDNEFPPLERVYIKLNSNVNGIDKIEYEIRKIFLFLLNKHIKKSHNNPDYYDTLVNFKNYLEFKYDSINYTISSINNVQEYLYNLVIKIINFLESIQDDEYKNEHKYATAILLQILLRTVFILIDDKKSISYFKPKNTSSSISKSIIKSAFVFNHNDLPNLN